MSYTYRAHLCDSNLIYEISCVKVEYKESGSSDNLTSFVAAIDSRHTKERTNSSDFTSHIEVARQTPSVTKADSDHQSGVNKFGGLKKAITNKDSAIQRKLSDDRTEFLKQTQRASIDIESRASCFKSDTDREAKPKKAAPTSSFLVSRSKTDLEHSFSQREDDLKDLPRPAPRSSSTRAPVGVNQTSSPSLSNVCVSGPTSSKRIVNSSRQNHGKAVAPPQLPSSALSGSTNRLMASANESSSGANGGETPFGIGETAKQLADEDSAIDFSQSPIAQRLLKHSKDHKGIVRLYYIVAA